MNRIITILAVLLLAAVNTTLFAQKNTAANDYNNKKA